jgi:hypothetical protein
MVGSATAAFVLLCSIYCACGDTGSAATASCHVSEAARAPQRAHCHGDADPTCSGPHDPHSPGRPDRQNGHHDSGGCGHCKRTLTTADSAKAHLAPLFACAFTPLTACVIPLHEQAAPHTPTCSGDLPPPQGPATLLGLHCALNT